ncbi:DUF4174 domain-containing protein [Octadecabacter sp. CECT 8868]|uniref:DUF4174 domain-containing protein n=1 Tax=Octadecabacter algicola TaxID=2909342 RepID=UPI001F3FA586|nr:DUF4174 domain-containing protein [Octadecabacter algicola]MCF2905470.1 DUF4174 domain-containing protein [Octadecabacter algicola]
MIRLLALLSLVLWASAGSAQDDVEPTVVDQWETDKTVAFDATSLDIDSFIWVARPVVVFADSPNDPRFIQQMDLLRDRADDLAERDVVILTDTDPDAESALRTRLRPRGFMLVIIGKDGEVELRKPSPWTVREITRSIDKMPLRQQEIVDRRAEP